MLNRERTLAAIDVMEGALEGKVVEYADRWAGTWRVCDCPSWNWAHLGYRLQPTPKPTYRPYTAEELVECMKFHKILVFNGTDNHYRIERITQHACGDVSVVVCRVFDQTMTTSWCPSGLRDSFTHAEDGTPFGVEVTDD